MDVGLFVDAASAKQREDRPGAQFMIVQKYGIHLLGVGSLIGWIVLAAGSRLVDRPLGLFLSVMLWEWVIFAFAWRVVAKQGAIAAWGVAFLACGLLSQPVMEDDHFRFLWDGYVFATTGNPYHAAPAAYFSKPDVPSRFAEILDQINYPHVSTIYGPLNELLFLVSYWSGPGRLWPWKLMLIGAQAVLLWTCLGISKKGGAPGSIARQVALGIAWCPLLIFETAFNAHPDVVGVALLMTGLWFSMRGRGILCGIACGAAMASKVFALLLIPLALQRSVKGWIAFAATVVGFYSIFWLQGSGADLGAALTFAKEWEFNSSVYGLIRALSTPAVARMVCSAAFVFIWLFFVYRGFGRENVVPRGNAIYGAFLLLSATVNPWYLIWIAPFVALRPSLTGFAAMGLVSLSYITGLNMGRPELDNFEHPIWVRIVEYGGLALVGLAEFVILRRRKRTLR